MSPFPSNPEDRQVWELFRGRCVVCGREAKTIHEILFRSSGKDAMRPENRVTLCTYHHNWAHRVGKKESTLTLKEHREKFLRLRGRHGSPNSGEESTA